MISRDLCVRLTDPPFTCKAPTRGKQRMRKHTLRTRRLCRRARIGALSGEPGNLTEKELDDFVDYVEEVWNPKDENHDSSDSAG
jgi:hypothetical protein